MQAVTDGEAPRPVWKGLLRFSLVSIPVKAVSARRADKKVSLSWLHKDCLQPIRYKKVCPIHGEVRQDEIISGYKVGPKRYVALDDSDLRALRPQREDAVQLETFVAEDAVDPVYLSGSSYYLLPNGNAAARPYVVFQRTLLESGRCAVGHAVLFRRRQAVLVRAVREVLVLFQLNFAAEVRPAETLDGEVPEVRPTAKEFELARSLVEATTDETFDYGTVQDEYAEGVRALVEKRKATVVEPEKATPDVVTLDFAQALKKSLQGALGKRKKARTTGRRQRKGA